MSEQAEERQPVCENPLDVELLADYWQGDLTEDEEERVEEHLLTCDFCGDRLRELIALADGIREVARQANLRMVLSESILERAGAEGLRIRQYAPPAGGSVNCTVGVEDDLLIGRLAANLAGANRVDLVLCAPDGMELMRMPDIPAPARMTTVIIQEPIVSAKQMPDSVMIARLVAVEAAGRERLLGEYTFNHTRTIP